MQQTGALRAASVVLAAAAAGAVILWNLWALWTQPWKAFVDFQAFYCGAHVAAFRLDPYLVEPLRACELAISPHRTWHVLPAPLPGYVFLLLAPLALLPYKVAALAWFAALVAAMAAVVRVVCRMTGLPAPAVVAAFALCLGYTALDLGQPVPIVVLALVAAAAALQNGKPALAGALAALTLIEPHVGALVVASIVCFVPRARLSTLGVSVALGAASLLYLGVPHNVEYLQGALHAQAIAESSAWNQYSTTVMLTTLGFGAESAVRGATVWYVLIAIVALVAVWRVRSTVGDDAVIVLLPAAAAVLGGPYIHSAQLAVAMPLALLLTAQRNAVPFAALIALSVPVDELINYPARIAPTALVVVLALGFALLEPERVRTVVRTGLITFGLCVATAVLAFTLARPAHRASGVNVTPPTALASESWRVDERARQVDPAWLFLAIKVPAWLGLGVVLVWPFTVAFRAGARARRDELSLQPQGANA